MQVDKNCYNYNNKVNFGAKRIMSATKDFGDLCEKFEVYRLDESDIPFAKKLVLYMQKQRSKLDNSQKKLLNQLSEFIKLENRDYFENLGIFSREKFRKLYIGIKNDEQISGFMQTGSCNVFGGKLHKIDDICTNVGDKVAEDTFLYAFFADKQLANGTFSLFGSNFNAGRAISASNSRKFIAQRNYKYDFTVTPQKEKFNLEEVLGIEEL